MAREYAPPAALAERIRAEAPSLEGERKQVTVLFADVSESMDLAEQVDAEEWRRIMDRFFVVLSDGVHRYEGTVVQFTGDGIMALFGAPIAHEDHAVRAGHAALRLCRDLSRLAAEVRREESLNFSVRLGLNSGEVVVGGIGEDLRVDFTAIGHTVGLAKRMESLAEPGKVYLTEHSARLVEGYFALRDLGPFDVKGVREPVRVFELAGPGRSRTRLDRARERGFSRFVGRERELGVLEQALERALAGDGGVVGVVGEPGVGKSRLCHEFVERCRARGIATFTAAGAAHARSVPFHVALEMLRGYFGIEDDMPAQAARERVAGRLLLLDPGFAPKLPEVFEFLGIEDPERPAPRMDPDARMRSLLSGAAELVEGHTAREPTVNLIEDMHWVDEGSRTFLDALIRAVGGRRALVVVNFRPELQADWMQLPEYTSLPLVPLGPEAVSELLEELLGTHPSLDGLPREILARTGGNPFFVEELVRALEEDGTLAGPRGAHRLARSLGALRAPPSVHDVLAARIDRLDAGNKAVLQAAAVAGREFSGDVVARATSREATELEPVLDGLVEGGFLFEGDADGEYVFRHPLTQEVAYGSLLAERRRRLHAAVARAVIDADAERLDERAALVAQHFEAADEALDAARWHARAAAWAGSRDPVHTAEHWEAVRRLVHELPRDAETIGLGLAACVWTLQFSWRLGIDDEGVDAVYHEGRELAEALGDDATLALITASWASVVGISRDMSLALSASAEAHELVLSADRPDAEVPILVFRVYALFVGADFDDALLAAGRGIELTERDRSLGAGVVVADPYGWFHMMRGFGLAVVGRIAEARAAITRSVELCAASGDLESQGWAHMNHGMMAYFSGDKDGLDENVMRSVEIADSIGSLFSRIWARYNLGLAHVMHERWEDAVETLRENLVLIRTYRTARECEPWTLAILSWALTATGSHEEGLEAGQEALELAEERGVKNVLPTAYNSLARACWASGEDARAAEHMAAGVAEAVARGAYGQEGALLADWAEATLDEDLRERATARLAANGATGRLEALAQAWASATPR